MDKEKKVIQTQFVSMHDLRERGYSYYKVSQMVSSGKIEKVNKKYYENLAYSGEINDFYAVPAYAEKGVICLTSAAVYYELTDERMLNIDVALPRQSRIPAGPDWPAMKFYLFSKERYLLGQKTISENGNTYRIYNMEKTVCDIVFYRNKLGFESAVQIVKNYVRREDRNINLLMEYAEKTRVETAMRQYLEVIL